MSYETIKERTIKVKGEWTELNHLWMFNRALALREDLPKGEHYYAALLQGRDYKSLMQQHGRQLQSIKAAIKRLGYTAPKVKDTEPIADLEMAILGSRLKRALRYMDVEEIEKSLIQMDRNRELVKLENVDQEFTKNGDPKKPVSASVKQFTPKSKEIIKTLSQEVRFPTDEPVGGSLIVRQALERVILSREDLFQFRRPEDWMPRPWALWQGGSNPVPPLDGKVWRTTLNIPLPMWAVIHPLQNQRGQQNSGLSQITRDALDNLNLATLNLYAMPTPHVTWAKTHENNISVSLLESHKERIAKAQGVLGNVSGGDAISAALAQHLQIDPRRDIRGWEYWETFLRVGGNPTELAKAYQITPEEAINALMDFGFLKEASLEKYESVVNRFVAV